MNNKIFASVKAGLFGFCVADALGVPYEFEDRSIMKMRPADRMVGRGTWNQPPGTWSDDSSLTFCTCEALIAKFDFSMSNINPQPISSLAMSKFCDWYYRNYWTARGEVFDVGGTTAKALENFELGVSPLKSGLFHEGSNGNGSLMRMLPLAYLHPYLDDDQLLEWASVFSHPTHAHPRSKIACGLYVLIAAWLLKGRELSVAYAFACETTKKYYEENVFREEIKRTEFADLLDGVVSQKLSTGYVLDSLSAALCCLLNNSNYRDTVLAAVNLGGDTDTIAAIAGGLAGIYYGYDDIPSEWLDILARRDNIDDLCEKFSEILC